MFDREVPPTHLLADFSAAILPGLPTSLIPRQRNIVPLRLSLLLGINNPLLDIGRQRIESLIHVDISLCADLEERNAEFVG